MDNYDKEERIAIRIDSGMSEEKAIKLANRECKKCGGIMKSSKAIAQTYTGRPDFIGGEVVTLSPGGSGKLIDCMKCVACGWSVIK